MNAYIGCCCQQEGLPCLDPAGQGGCGPVAIVVEGEARVSMHGLREESSTKEIHCAICDPQEPFDELEEKSRNTSGAKFATVRFKALLQQDPSAPQRYLDSNPLYPSATSLFAGREGSITSENSNTRVSCFSLCLDDESRNSRFIEEQTSDREDPVVIDFNLVRTAEYVSCPAGVSGFAQCSHLIDEGCYETFELNLLFTQLMEINESISSYKREDRFNNNTGDCEDFFPPNLNYSQSTSNEVNRTDGQQWKRFAFISPNSNDSCPQNRPRPASILYVSGVSGNPANCIPPSTPHRCVGMIHPGETLFAYGFREPVETINFLGELYTGACNGMLFTSGPFVVNEFNHEQSASANCNDSDVSCLFSIDSGFPSSAAPKGPFNRRGLHESTIGGAFVLTRHELLTSLPSPSDWPNNV
tara:strand:- start:2479 stop:3723 length:1245 start_codon:yes stop_codon:yes gene_type:complete